jgi:hypothetical protein
MLGNQVSNGDLDRLVLTERYRLLLAGLVGTATSTELPVQRVVNGLVSLELDERVADFDVAIKALQRQIARWSAYGHYVVPDTSFYIHHRDKLEAVDFGPLINVWQPEVAVLVPIVIVDELDQLKESKDKFVRWRAGYTLAVLDRVFADGVNRARLQPGDVVPGPDGLTRSEVTIELVFDPPGMCGCRATTTRSSTGPWLSRHWRTETSRCSPTTPASLRGHVTLASESLS